MTYKQQQHLRSLLTDAIVELCRRESFYVEELRIEGTICIVSDRNSVVIAQITEQVGEKTSDAEVDNERITFEDDDDTLPFRNKDLNADDETRSNTSREEVELKTEDRAGGGGRMDGSSNAMYESKSLALETNHLDETAMNVGLEVAEQLANIMSMYDQMPKSECDSPLRQLSPFIHSQSSSAVQASDVLPPLADVIAELDDSISLERSANGKFQCPYCAKAYGFKHTLKEHLNKHLGKRPHICKHCGDTFTHLASLCAHVKRRHDDQMPMEFQCAICHEKLMNYQSLKQHYTWRHKDMKFPDDKVDQDMLNSVVFDGESNCHPVRKRRRIQRRSFIPTHDDAPVLIGDEFYSGEKKIKSEFDVNNTSIRLDSSAILEAFERRDYEALQEGIDQSLLDNLELSATEIKMKDDATGMTSFQSPSDTIHHTQMIAKYFEEVHVETEHGIYRYRCKFCNNMFKIRNSLYEHLNSHFGKKPHQCSFCGDSFAHHSSLHNHIRNKHSFQTSAEKQASFKHCCPGCERKFRFRSELERHLKCNPDHSMQSV